MTSSGLPRPVQKEAPQRGVGASLRAERRARAAPRFLDAVATLHAAGYRHGDLCLWNVLWSEEEEAVRLIDFTVGRKCVESECDDDLIIIEEDNLEALSRGTDLSPDEAWADAVAAMGPDRARMFSSDADVEPVPGLGFGLGVD